MALADGGSTLMTSLQCSPGRNAWKEAILFHVVAKICNLFNLDYGRCKFSLH